MDLIIKICGICSEGDLGQISALKPDAVGFIQWPKSKRFVEAKAVGQWETPEGIKRVGVFVCPTEAELAHAAQHARLDVLQVHQLPDHWNMDKAFFQGLEFWRALSPDELYYSESRFPFDRYLLDSYDPVTVGGTGRVCDWEKAKPLVKSINKPIILAGGLTPENVAEAIQQVKPWGVDVSSGVEKEPGVKDLARVEAFIAAARGA
ncbi:MAG: phosphoribosylanthranilate isomerase [Pontiella sp.]